MVIDEETIQMWYDLACGYYFGKNGMEENNEEAVKWFKKAALHGHVASLTKTVLELRKIYLRRRFGMPRRR